MKKGKMYLLSRIHNLTYTVEPHLKQLSLGPTGLSIIAQCPKLRVQLSSYRIARNSCRFNFRRWLIFTISIFVDACTRAHYALYVRADLTFTVRQSSAKTAKKDPLKISCYSYCNNIYSHQTIDNDFSPQARSRIGRNHMIIIQVTDAYYARTFIIPQR